MAGVLAMEVMFFYTMIQMDYGLNLANYDSGRVIAFKLLTSFVSLFFAAISFAVLYYVPRFFSGNRFFTTILYVGLPLFLFSNVIYHRYFEMPLNLGVLHSIGNLPFVSGYVLVLARFGDMIYPLCAALLLFVGFKHPPEKGLPRLKTAILLIIVFLISSFMRTGVFVASLSIKHGSLQQAVDDTILNKTDFSIVATRYGFLTLFANNLISTWKHRGQELNIDSRSQYVDQTKTPSRKSNGPNVIMVQVESLDYEVLGKKVEGREVTPFLNSLIPRSLFFTSFFAQHTGQGGTSDADFSSLTSFYPLAYKPSFYASGLENLATLPFVLQLNGYTTTAFHANKAGFWGRSSAFRKIGFERFYSLRDFAGLPGKGVYVADGPFLVRTLESLEKLVEPYFAYVITMSSHGDFNRLKYVSEEMVDKEIRVPADRQTENYFRVINYVDSSLEKFFDGLMVQNKPFILVIYGDHTSAIRSDKYVSRAAIAERVPLFIITGNEGEHRKVDTPGSQIDLPPTVLSLVGIPSPSHWQGIDLISQHRERLYLKNQRASVENTGEIKTLASNDREWEETVFAIEDYIR